MEGGQNPKYRYLLHLKVIQSILSSFLLTDWEEYTGYSSQTVEHRNTDGFQAEMCNPLQVPQVYLFPFLMI